MHISPRPPALFINICCPLCRYRGALKDNTQAAKLGHWLAKGAMESDDRAAEDYKAAGPKASWPVEVLAGFEEAMAEDG